MPDYYITFGVQYGHGKNQVLHPVFKELNANGYVRVTAPTSDEAVYLVNDMIGDKWSFIYNEPPEERFAPLGEIFHWEAVDG